MRITRHSPARHLVGAAIVMMLAAGIFLPLCLFSKEWKETAGPRQWSFPGDHGSHPEYRTEWWYFTGNLNDKSGKRYGYQLTFFRYGLSLEQERPLNVWSVRDAYLAHFAITDVSGKAFHHRDRISRKGPGLAGAKETGMDVRVLGWSAVMENKRIHLKAFSDGMEIDLRLVPAKPLVFHGKRGLSKKGQGQGQASYYYSFTDLRTEGMIRVPGMTASVEVKGISWFDQEFGSNQLAPEQAGWDWFALHIGDGRDLMVYYLRKKDGSVEMESSGTLVERDGTSRHLNRSDIETTVLSYWKSEKSGGRYPAGWRIRVPAAAIDITVSPLVADQEMITTASTGITYWEGAVAGKATSLGKEVTVEGYVELTGYAGTLGGVF